MFLDYLEHVLLITQGALYRSVRIIHWYFVSVDIQRSTDQFIQDIPDETRRERRIKRQRKEGKKKRSNNELSQISFHNFSTSRQTASTTP